MEWQTIYTLDDATFETIRRYEAGVKRQRKKPASRPKVKLPARVIAD